MSVFISSACWYLEGLSSPQKFVLISLADQANDEGVCWPSNLSVSIRTALSERTVRNAMRDLEAVGLIQTHMRPGKKTYYTVTPNNYRPLASDPGSSCPPASAAPHPGSSCPPPRQLTTETPAAPAPKPSGTINEPSINRKGAAKGGAKSAAKSKTKTKSKPAAVELPDWMPADVWADFVEMRKKSKAEMTDRAQELAIAKLDVMRRQGHDPVAVVNQSIFHTWKGLFPVRNDEGTNYGQANKGGRAAAGNQSAVDRVREAIGPDPVGEPDGYFADDPGAIDGEWYPAE